MDCGNRNDMSAVLLVKIIQIRGVLEIVGIDFAAFHNVIRLNVIGELFHIQGDVFGSQNVLCNRQYLGMRSRRGGNGNLRAG